MAPQVSGRSSAGRLGLRRVPPGRFAAAAGALGIAAAREGGLAHLERIRAIVEPELNWSDARWARECEAYRRLWQQNYGAASD